MQPTYPYSRQQITAADVASVTEAMQAPFLTQGPKVGEFEGAFSAYLRGPEVVACSSGTAALHLAFMALGLGPERGLLTSPITFVASATAARMTGAPVVFADVDPTTGNLHPDAVRTALMSSRVPIAAIAPVHLAGRPCDMASLRAIADEFGCFLVEDACHAPGAYYVFDGVQHPAGACMHSDCSAFSFHAVKHVAMGEGGAVCTRNSELVPRLRRLRNHGLSREAESWITPPEPQAPWYYEMSEVGWNYRLTDLQCALGLSQLSRLDDSLAARRRIAARYRDLLQEIPCVTLPIEPASTNGHAWHLFPLRIDFEALGKRRGTVMRELAAAGVGTQVHYIPLYHQPYFKAMQAAPLPGAEDYYWHTLSIPMYPQLSDDDLDAIAAALHKALAP